MIYAMFFASILVQWRTWGFFDFANPIVFSLNYHLAFLSLGVFVFLLQIYPAYTVQPATIDLVLLSYCFTTFSAFFSFLILGSAVNIKAKLGSYSRFSGDTNTYVDSFARLGWWLAVILTIAVFFRSGFSAFFSIFSGENFENARVEAVSGNGFLILPAQVLLLICTTWLIVNKNNSSILKVFYFSIATACMISFGFRSGIAFLIVITIFYYLYSRYGKPPLLKSICFVFLVLSIVVFMGVLRQGTEGLSDRFFASFFWRSFVTLHNLDVILNDYKNFLHGGGVLMELGVLIPGPDINLGTYLKNVLGYDFPGGGITPSYIGAGYVDFGISGAIIYPILTGFILATSYVFWPAIVGKSKFSFLLMLVFSTTTSGISAAGIIAPYLYFGIPVLFIGIAFRLLISIRYSFFSGFECKTFFKNVDNIIMKN